ncbi:MAG: N-acetyltransferase family protein [Spirochaetia bacterium]
MHCASVAHRPTLYRKGIGSAMLQYLVDWARESGWERIEGWAFEDSSTDDAYRWIPSLEFWEKAGAKRGDVPIFSPDTPPPPGPVREFSIDLQ